MNNFLLHFTSAFPNLLRNCSWVLGQCIVRRSAQVVVLFSLFGRPNETNVEKDFETEIGSLAHNFVVFSSAYCKLIIGQRPRDTKVGKSVLFCLQTYVGQMLHRQNEMSLKFPALASEIPVVISRKGLLV
jgi:hypothetical protein